MISSLWIAKTGLDAQQTNMDVVANNLANVSTNGFKRQRAVFEDLLYQTIRQPGAQSSEQTTLPSGLQIGTGVRPVATERLRFLRGQELLKEYRSSPDKVRVFCSVCGSPIYSAKDDQPGIRRLRVGTVDTPFVCREIFHIFTDSKAPWWEIADTHPKYAKRRP